MRAAPAEYPDLPPVVVVSAALESYPAVLAARRQALEVQLAAATLARLDANESRYRLLLDAHQLWPLEVVGKDEDHAHYGVVA